MKTINEENKEKIYIFTKLFNVFDRKTSYYFWKRIKSIVEEHIGTDVECFLPYKDSNEVANVTSNKAKEIYKIDRQILNNTIFMLGLLDGPAYDSGIGYEIGYSYSKNIPSLAISTDYFKLRKLNSQDIYSIDPLLEIMSTTVQISGIEDKKDSYIDDIDTHIELIYDEITSYIKDNKHIIRGRGKKDSNLVTNGTPKYDIFLEVIGSRFEWSNYYIKKIESICKEKGYSIYVANRYENGKNIRTGAKDDLQTLANSKNIIVVGDSVDVDLGSAMLQGYASGLNKNIIFLCTDKIEMYAQEDFVMIKNLMIHASANYTVNSLEELEREFDDIVDR